MKLIYLFTYLQLAVLSMILLSRNSFEEVSEEEAQVFPEEAPVITEEAPVITEEAQVVEEAPVIMEEAQVVEEAPVIMEEAPVIMEEAQVVLAQVPKGQAPTTIQRSRVCSRGGQRFYCATGALLAGGYVAGYHNHHNGSYSIDGDSADKQEDKTSMGSYSLLNAHLYLGFIFI
ncbi:hypothetical protein HYPBUDRAFT_168386 [Hyphopichia burtonii NRRL Y-1933]|uniref:Uncharacterized protein n=1 Tax=Hyphopichia burtonii NRRL Y-1933 TaxID=984485 RepID=A0A1E4REJ5_9ASCO|nr:hypothetical protein HYPBUDRAFT_168386 [Hyphopichia burtonii NRRL Y-1933]ODV65663.1 hypothetical protein HYPBUDRAFT_168386 [Hyphopichia burtonii NRRL Y-1933]